MQRLLWFATEGDLLVLPTAPSPALVNYITSLTKVAAESLRILIPPAGVYGTEWLTADRVMNPLFIATARREVARKSVSDIFWLFPDAFIAMFASALGLHSALGGAGFLSQDGGILVNSKASFRAIAAGCSLPLPPGAVFRTMDGAADYIAARIDHGETVILKNDFMSGGQGNEMLTALHGLRPYGARRVNVVSNMEDIRSYLADNWEWLTGKRHRPVIVEKYFPNSRAVFFELQITERAIEYGGCGEMIYAPVSSEQILPIQNIQKELLDSLTRYAYRLCESLKGVGYRGTLSADAIITPDNQLLFTEYNGRVTASTHLYDVIGRRIVGESYERDRVILECIWAPGWSAPSLADAIDAVEQAGLAYSGASRSGVILLNDLEPRDKSIVYCIVAESMQACRAMQSSLQKLFQH